MLDLQPGTLTIRQMFSPFTSFQRAYISLNNALSADGVVVKGVVDPTSVGSHWGRTIRDTRELLALKFELDNPHHRLLGSRVRNLNLAFLTANVIWTIGGGHDVEMISFYNSRGRAFANQGTFYEASFGARLFSPGHQLRHAERRLKSDPSSRRAVALIYALEDSLVDRRDTPCAISLHFLIRGDKLVCITTMRSQSSAMVLPYDVFLFTVLQEIIAVRLGVECGSYIHVSDSVHYYQDEQKLIDQVITSNSPLPDPMPIMTSASDDELAKLVQAEQLMRLGAARGGGSLDEICDRFGLSTYWRNFLIPIYSFITSTQLPMVYWGSV